MDEDPLAKLLALPKDGRIDLNRGWWDRVEPENLPPLTAEQQREIERRLAAHMRKPARTSRWSKASTGNETFALLVVPEAETELAEAGRWFESKRPGGGAEFAHALEVALVAITRDPHQHPVVFGDVRRAMLRGFPYALMYAVAVDEV